MFKSIIFGYLIAIATGCMFSKQSTKTDPAYLTELNTYRQTYVSSVTSGAKTPLQPEDAGFLHFFDIDQTYRVECDVSTDDAAKPFEMPTYSGVTRTYIRYAICTCNLNGKSLNVELYRNLTQPANPAYRNHLFLPFKDLTNGDESYGGGRYINLDINDIKEGKITIDFNKTYNPYCAYSEGYNCPIPPRANHFETHIRAGEKNYTGPIRQRSVD